MSKNVRTFIACILFGFVFAIVTDGFEWRWWLLVGTWLIVLVLWMFDSEKY